MPDVPELLDVPAVADLYPGGYEEQVRGWFRSGELAGFKLGNRWFTTADDWRAFIDARRRGGDVLVGVAVDAPTALPARRRARR